MDPVGKLIKIALALALTGLVIYFFGFHSTHGPVRLASGLEQKV